MELALVQFYTLGKGLSLAISIASAAHPVTTMQVAKMEKFQYAMVL
jgi:hypothetical protein